MATIDDVAEKLDNITSRLEDIEQMVFTPQAIHTLEGLSDIDQNLGLMKAGEFRTGAGTPGKGSGFSGVRMGYPGFTYGGNTYNIVGVEGDVVQFGLRSSDGLAMFSEGEAAFGSRGMRFTADPAVSGTSDADKSRLRWYIASSTVTGVSSDANALPISQFAMAADTDEHRTTLYMSPNATQGTVVTTDGDFEQRIRLQSLIDNPEHAGWDISARYQTVYPYAGYLGFVPPETGNASYTLDGSGTITQNTVVRSVVQVISAGGDDDMNYLLPYRNGALVVLIPNADDETITVKNAVSTADGHFRLAGGADFALDSALDRLVVLGHDDGTDKFWVELSRSNNG